MISKDERQEIAIQKWRLNKGIGTLNFVQRFGKTRCAKLIINKILDKEPNTSILIIVPNDITKRNAKEHLYIKDKDIKIYSIFEFINILPVDDYYIESDLVIYDEPHKMLSGKSFKALKRIKAKYTLGLTGAKLSDNDLKKFDELNIPIIDKIDELEAVENGWIANFIEYNVPVQFNESDKVIYNKYSELIQDVLYIYNSQSHKLNNYLGSKIFKSDFDVVMAAYVGKKYVNQNGRPQYIKSDLIRNLIAMIMGYSPNKELKSQHDKNIVNWYSPNNIYERAKLFRQYVTNRDKLLCYNKEKLNECIKIIKKFDVPTICFNQVKEMVDELHGFFNKTSVPYHSTIESRPMWDHKNNDWFRLKNGEVKHIGKTRLKQLAIEGMKDGTVKQLFTVKALNEGLTIENIELVITTGGDINPETHNQRTARGKTLDYSNPNKTCIIINLYMDDFVIKNDKGEDVLINSRDKQKLKLRQKQCDHLITWVEKIDDIPQF